MAITIRTTKALKTTKSSRKEMIWAVVSPVNPLIENGNGLLTATRLPSISVGKCTTAQR